MKEQEARALVTRLTHEQKLSLLKLLDAIEVGRKGIRT